MEKEQVAITTTLPLQQCGKMYTIFHLLTHIFSTNSEKHLIKKIDAIPYWIGYISQSQKKKMLINLEGSFKLHFGEVKILYNLISTT